MHRSRLGTVVIDCQVDDLDSAGAFWAAALGCTLVRRYEPGDETYRLLDGDPTQPKMLLQKVGHPSRIHLDIEADDIEAEVLRLERLGAKRLRQIRGWWVMEAPSGHRFCVVKPQRQDFESNATTWRDE